MATALHSLRNSRPDVLLATQVVLVLVLIFSAKLAATTLTRARDQGFQRNLAAIALVTDVHDLGQLLWADYHPDEVLTLVEYMRKERLSVFSEPESSLLGRQLNSAFILTPDSDCVGKVESTKVITGVRSRSLRITGWAWDDKDSRPPAAIIVATHGTITGLGAMGDWHATVLTASAGLASNFFGFTAYVRDVPASSTLELYAIPRKGWNGACHLATLAPK
jgi:hypothetical protein